jgi:hypothetical protein
LATGLTRRHCRTFVTRPAEYRRRDWLAHLGWAKRASGPRIPAGPGAGVPAGDDLPGSVLPDHERWQGRRWAWTAAIAFEVVHIVADIGFVLDRSFALDKFVGLIVILAILSYLTRPAVRAYFCSKESDA